MKTFFKPTTRCRHRRSKLSGLPVNFAPQFHLGLALLRTHFILIANFKMLLGTSRINLDVERDVIQEWNERQMP